MSAHTHAAMSACARAFVKDWASSNAPRDQTIGLFNLALARKASKPRATSMEPPSRFLIAVRKNGHPTLGWKCTQTCRNRDCQRPDEIMLRSAGNNSVFKLIINSTIGGFSLFFEIVAIPRATY